MRRIHLMLGTVALAGCCVPSSPPCTTVQSAAPCAVETFVNADGSRRLYQRYVGGIHVERLAPPAQP